MICHPPRSHRGKGGADSPVWSLRALIGFTHLNIGFGLKLALIGFVFAAPPDAQVFTSPFIISVYTRSAFSQIGFVLQKRADL